MDIIKNPTNPDICETPKSIPDISKRPDFFTNLSKLSSSIEPWLCEVIKIARDPNADPVIRPGYDVKEDGTLEEFDISPWLNSLTSLTGIGDPRLDLGTVMTRALDKYLPIMKIQEKILQDGCQIIDQSVCDSDGKPIYKIKDDCNYNEEITVDSLKKYVIDMWEEETTKDANNFAAFLKKTYIDNGWNLELVAWGDNDLEKMTRSLGIPIFFARATLLDKNKNVKDSKFHKYYFDARNKVASSVGLSIKIEVFENFFFGKDAALKAEENTKLMKILTGSYWPYDKN